MHYAQMHHGHGAHGSSGGGGSGNAFLAGANLKILALCEVAEVPTLRKVHPDPHHSPLTTQPSPAPSPSPSPPP